METNPAAPEPSPVPAVESEVSVEPAGFWVRGGAALVDGIILVLGSFIPVPVLPYLVGPAYKTIFVSQGGQTPGKMAAGLRVIRADGEPVGVGRALGRALAEYLSYALLGLGLVAAAFGEKRALHDYIAGTRVVYLDNVSKGRRILFTVLGVVALFTPVLAVVGGVAASLSGGKLHALQSKSKEGVTKGSLGSLRAAAAIFYGDSEGVYPATLDALVNPKYLQEIPAAKTASHAETRAWTAYGNEVCSGAGGYGQGIDASKIRDTGGWGYVGDPQSKCYGQVFVDCAHKDTMGKPWTEY